MKYLNERGYALFLTIAVITLITVLALGLITVTSNSNKTTVNERYDQSLYYIAESGINLEKAKVTKILNTLHHEAIKELNTSRTEEEFRIFISPYGDVNGFYKNYIEDNFCSEYGDIVDVSNCSKNIEITFTNKFNHYNTQFNKQPVTDTKTSGECTKNRTNVNCSFSILSSAIYDGEPTKSRSLKQIFKIDFNTTPISSIDKTISGVPLDNLAAFITGNITVNGNAHSVKGNIASTQTLNNVNFTDGFKRVELNGSTNLNTVMPIMPTLSNEATNLTKINDTILSGDVKIAKLEMNTNIYIGENDVNLFVDEADLTGVKIYGSGKINIIIKNNINIDGMFNVGGNSSQTTVFYGGFFPKIGKETVINASLYTKTVPDFTGQGSLNVKGNIYHPGTELLTLSGNSSLKANSWVAPNAKIELKGGGGNSKDNFTGTIIAKELLINGNINLVGGSNIALSTSYKYGSTSDAVKESSLEEILNLN